MGIFDEAIKIILVGMGATLVMDIWSSILKRLGNPTLDYALVGRWVGHMLHGRFAHEAIGRASPIAGERWLGWMIHYATGVVFAGLLVRVAGSGWLANPTLLPALSVGVATVAFPLCIMQPAMGAGFAASRTPTPMKNRLRSLATHAVFGCGMYLAAVCLWWGWGG